MNERAEQEAWLSSVLELTPTALCVVELGSGRLLYANPAAERLGLGHRPREGQHATGARGEELAPSEMPRQRAARREQLDGVILNLHGAHGTTTLIVRSGVVPERAGHPALAVLSYQDVTALSRAEAALRDAIGARDEFFSVATHELKSPLAGLSLLLELLARLARGRDAIPVAELMPRLENARRQVNRMVRLVGNLLDLGRIRNGRLDLVLERFDLAPVVSEVAESFREQARLQGSPLEISAGSSVEGAWDRLRMEQVITNLVSNAIKYGAGTPVRVSLERRADAARIVVADDGLGIPLEHQERIFEPFERAEEGYRAESLGLGLYITREIVHAHGGAIGVASEPGKGAAFRVDLPIRALPEEGT